VAAWIHVLPIEDRTFEWINAATAVRPDLMTGRTLLNLGGGIEFLSGPAKHYRQPDVVVSLNGESWAKLHLNQSGLASLVETSEAKLTKGDIETAAALLELFDALEP